MKRVLMLSISLWLILSLSLNGATLSHAEIKTMVKKIKEKRIGIEVSVLEDTPNPFALVEKGEEVKEEVVKKEKPKVIKKEVVHNLTAILNHAAFIDGKWYKVGDKIGRFILVSINHESVDLKFKKEQKKLSIKKEKKKFILDKGN